MDKLTDEQVERMLDALAEDRSIGNTARRLDVPVQLVRDALAEPGMPNRALARKRDLLGVQVVGEIIDALRAGMSDPKSTGATRVSAAKELRAMLGVVIEKKKPATKKKARVGGQLEAALK